MDARPRTTTPAMRPVDVRVEGDGEARALRLSESFVVGRDPACEVQIASPTVSRRHVAVERTGSRWHVRDLDSRNGTWVNGERVASLPVGEGCRLRLGRDGPTVELRVEPPPRERGRSLDDYVRHYLSDGDAADAGEHTRMIRQAFVKVSRQRRRKAARVLAAVGGLALALVAFAVAQHFRLSRQAERLARQQSELDRQERAAAELFEEMKALDVELAQMRLALEGAGNASLASQLKKLEDGRRRLAEKYDGYVAELGVYRRLTEDERPIYRMARAFNETEVSMPVSFVRLVRETMAGYWLTPAGRSRFERAIRSAETRGHTRRIVETLRRYGLPPQLFYVALQESNLETSAVGPLTRWGRAKGMWQLIPSTAIRFGLDPGPFANQEGVDAGDERFDFAKSTEAAARYLQTIYGTLAQASGLLVVASYNWGEHRVVDKLENLTGPQSIPPEALAGIGENPRDRTYWRFLVEYRDRMPDETRDYVLKIFSAAVIGEDPRRHGFALDNPLARYVEEG